MLQKLPDPNLLAEGGPVSLNKYFYWVRDRLIINMLQNFLIQICWRKAVTLHQPTVEKINKKPTVFVQAR